MLNWLADGVRVKAVDQLDDKEYRGSLLECGRFGRD